MTIDDMKKYKHEWYLSHLTQIKTNREARLKKQKELNPPILVEHHTKYKEIDGVDETTWIPMDEHVKIHLKHVANGRKIPPEIVRRAHQRTEKAKIRRLLYQRTPKSRRTSLKYSKQNIMQLEFTETIEPFIQLYEYLRYNSKTGNVVYSSRFRGNDGAELKQIPERGDFR